MHGLPHQERWALFRVHLFTHALEVLTCATVSYSEVWGPPLTPSCLVTVRHAALWFPWEWLLCIFEGRDDLRQYTTWSFIQKWHFISADKQEYVHSWCRLIMSSICTTENRLEYFYLYWSVPNSLNGFIEMYNFRNSESNTSDALGESLKTKSPK